MEGDLRSVVGDLVKPQAAFTFRTTAGYEVLLSSMQRDKLCNKARADKHTAALAALCDCFSGCVCLRGYGRHL